jgi:hypothetical protein
MWQHQVFNMKKIILIFAFLFFMAPGSVFAQSLELSMTPPLIEVAIKPDKSVVIAYTLTNSGDPSVFTTYVRPFLPQGVYGELQIAPEFSGPVRFNLENSNIQLDTPFFLKSGQGQQLLMKIRVPQGTPEGDYYYTFIAENVPGKLAEGTSTPVTQGAIGANILISVTNSGVFESSAHISQLKVMPRYTLNLFGKKFSLFESSDPIPVRLIAQNSGKSLVKPEGVMRLKGTFGGEEEFVLLPENILANSSRLLHATPSGKLNTNEASLTIQGFHLGKFVLTSTLTFGNKNQPVRSSVIFYAVPFKLFAATMVAIMIGILIIKKFTSKEEMVKIDEDAL